MTRSARDRGEVTIRDVAYPLELSALFRLALRYGHVRLTTHRIDTTISCCISRQIGNSEIQTGFSSHETPEQAMLTAIEEAERWGLPDLEVTV